MPPTPPLLAPPARHIAPRMIVSLVGPVALLSALVLALLALPALAARAGTPATLTVTLLTAGSTATQSQYQAVAAGFAAQAQLTVTFGDGSGISPLSAKTDANGGFTSFWTLNAANKYCGTLTATDGTSTATASFWVALATDTQSGTACTGTTSLPTDTPAATAAPTQASATPVATRAPPPPPAVTSPPSSGSSLGTRVRGVLARIPGGLATVIAGSVVAILILVGLIALVMLNRNRGEDAARASSRGMPVARGGLTPRAMPTHRTPAMGQPTAGRHPYDLDAGFNGKGMGGPSASWSNGAMRAPRGGQLDAPRGVGPVRTPPPWVGDPGATPGRTGSYRMPNNRAARHAMPPTTADQRWDRGRPGARARHDAPADRDEDGPPDPSWR